MMLHRFENPIARLLPRLACTVAIAALTLTAACRATADEAESNAVAEQFFERQIRPAFIEHCHDCHSAETEASGGLLLDSRQGWTSGGDLGPAIVPGRPQDSLLMRVIEYEDPDLQMPPDGKLDGDVIASFRRWIELGAVDPRATVVETAEPKTGLPVDRAEEHWAYRPVRPANATSQPVASYSANKQSDAAASPLDRWINKALVAEGLSPAAAAPKRELIRRLTFDLHGLPPTQHQIAAFERDTSPDAYRRLVERLLASPHFAEHFARHWLDVARYAESITLRGFVLPNAWRYRDYVINAYAQDRPFDEMIRDQLAGDLRDCESLDERQLRAVATGFLALGNTNLEDQDKTKLDFDYIDEQLETIGRAFLGQTIGCARCHDHKFDPIPTRDYYALAAIMRSTTALRHDNVSKWIDQPLPIAPASEQRFTRLAVQVGSLDRALEDLKSLEAKLADNESPAERSTPVEKLAGIVVDDEQATYVGAWRESQHSPGYVADGYRHDDNRDQGGKTVTFEPRGLTAGSYEVRISYTSSANRATNVHVRVFSANESSTVIVNQRRPPTLNGLWTSLGEYPFEANGQAYVLVSNEDADGHVIVDAVQFLPVGPSGFVASDLTTSDAVNEDHEAERKQLAEQRSQLVAERKRLSEQLEQRPRYISVEEVEPKLELEVRIRGNVHQRGDPVPRGFLTAVPPAKELAGELDATSSGRRQLADWIADPRNPLTARVYANRVWSWLIGEGLVATENNFGTAGESPSHPELLDWLANELILHQWSTQHLVRTIVCSDAYRRRRVRDNADAIEIDPNNRLLWSANLRRVPVEAIRDAMLQVSGELDRRMYGSVIRSGTAADYNYRHESLRRSIYSPVFRNSLPPLYRVFDFADTSVSVGQRPRSTVATQSLAMLNHPWIIARSEAAAAELSAGQPSLEALIDRLYWECFGRPPLPDEQSACLEYFSATTTEPIADKLEQLDQRRLQAFVHALFASIDFRFLE